MNLMNNGQLTGLIKSIFCPLVFKNGDGKNENSTCKIIDDGNH